MTEITDMQYKKKNQFIGIWKRFKKNKLALAGLIFIVIVLILSTFANLIADYDTRVVAQYPSERMQTPNLKHWFGTDFYGRDIFARVIHGSRISLAIGLSSILVSVVIGGMLGAIAGFFGKRIDNVIMRIMDVLMSIPPMLLAIAIVAALGANIVNLLLAITIAIIPSFTRIARAVVISIGGQDYSEAAKACGSSNARIIIRHIIPNAMGPIIVQATMGIASMIIVAASLSFLGLGVQPPTPEWGSMLSEAKDYITDAPYMVIVPGMCIVLTALSINLIGDGLRDALDPRLKN